MTEKFALSRRQFLKVSGTACVLGTLGAGVVSSSLAALSSEEKQKLQGSWQYGYCRMCMRGDCANQFLIQSSVVMEVKGNKESPTNKGALCPRGLSVLQNLYNPYRVKAPMKRTNPKKGLDVDPGWVEISWDEALDIVAKKFKDIHEKDPRGLLVNLGFGNMDFFTTFIPYIPAVFGTPNLITSNGPLCTVHYATELVQGCFPVALTDYIHCEYHITIGRSTGGNIGAANGETRAVADAIDRGMKLVVVDPRSSPEAAKGEWVPILPGTDLAFVLGLIHTVMFEIKKMDEDFLTSRTNGPYLIGADGGYFRKADGKPQVIDDASGRIMAFDDPRLSRPKLIGSAETPSGRVQTSFSLIRESMREYTPEWAQQQTTIPAATIRRIAGEFVSHARIGSTIDINGKTLPFRPVSIIGERGSMNHQDGTILDLATKVLNELVGAMDVPGGCMGCNIGPVLKPDADGTVHPAHEAIGVPFKYPPQSVDLSEYFPHRHAMPYLAFAAMKDPEKYGLEYKIQGALCHGGNTVIGSVTPDKMADALASVPFVATIAYHFDEVAALSDVLLPVNAQLEERSVNVYETTFGGFGPDTMGLQMVMVRDPVPPMHNTRQAQDIVLQLFKRMGLLPAVYDIMNKIGVMMGEVTMVQLPDKLKLDPQQEYTIAQIWDRSLQVFAGEGHDLKWFSENNGLWKRYIPREQCYNYYYFPEGKTRYQIYFEGLRASGKRLRDNLAAHDISLPDVNLDDMFQFFGPIPKWRLTALNKASKEYDLLAFNFKIPYNNNRLGGLDQLPWLMEAGEALDPYYNVICINPETAAKKGFSNGQRVWVESQYGKLKGQIKVSHLFHPGVVAVAGAIGRMVQTLGKAPARRLHFNRLLGAPLNTIDPIAGGVEITARVKVYSA